MNKEEAVRIFDIVVKEHMLPATLDKLVPLSFMGSAAVKFYQAKVKLMDQLGATEEQRKATLADGQDAGEMLLNIEARIGELVEMEPEAKAQHKGQRGGARPSGQPPKHERLGVEANRMRHATAIHRNPATVAAIIKEARENEDIPTKTAVLNKIKANKLEATLKSVNQKMKAKEGRAEKRLPEKFPKAVKEYLDSCTAYREAIKLAIRCAKQSMFDPTSINIITGRHDAIRSLMQEMEELV